MWGKMCGVAWCSVLSRSNSQVFAGQAHQCDLIIVPTPWSVRISSSKCVLDAAVDDMHALDPVARGVERRADLRQHAAGQRAVGDHFVDLLGRDPGDQLAVLVEYAGRVGQQHQLLGLEHLGDLAGDDVGVDVVGLAILADADRRDDRDEGATVEVVDQRRVNLGDFADLADVDQVTRIVLVFQHQLLGTDAVAVLACKADGLAAVLVDQVDDVLVYLPAEHHLDDFHGFGIGNAHALNELALLANTGEQILDLRAATVDDDDIEADQFEQDDIACEAAFQMLVGHRVAAVFDDDGLAVETLDVGQGFGEDCGLDAGGKVFDAHGVLRKESPRIVQRKRPERGSGLCNVDDADYSTVSRLFGLAARLGRVSSRTPSLNLAAALLSSISWPSWNERDTLPK